MSKTLRVGVIGLGMGQFHVQNYRKAAGCEVVALADVDEKRLKAFADEQKIEARYTDAAKMLEKEKLDVVSVATPNKFHCPLTVAALEAGAHVLCEKPMALSQSQCHEMLQAARKANRRLMINFSYRFTEQSQALKQLVDSGFLGEVYTARTCWLRRRGMPGFGGWFGQKDMAGGGPLIDLGVHRIDLALWLMGYPQPAWVMGTTNDAIARELADRAGKKFDVENHATGMVKFQSGASLLIEASWACNRSEPEYMETRLYGTKAGLVQKNQGGGYQFIAQTFEERAGCQYDSELKPPFPASSDAMQHFIAAIRDDVPHSASGEEGLIVQQILDGLYESARSGEPIKIA